MRILELGRHSEQLHGAWTRPFFVILYGCLGSIAGAACMIHRASRQKTRRGSFWPFILALCEGAIPSIVVELVIIAEIGKLFKVDLVSENGTDTTESLDELVSFAGSVRHELQVGTEVLVGLSKPFEERA